MIASQQGSVRSARRARAHRVGDDITGAVQVPRGILEAKADPASPRHDPALDPGRQVIVFCRSGARAALAGVTLDGSWASPTW